MSRFGNLEFEGGREDHSAGQANPALKGEAHYFTEARAAFENGNFESALRLFSKVLEFNPQNAAAWTGQVRMLIELGEFGEAKLWADKALEKFPHEPELLAAKAVALARSGDLQGALAFSDSAIEERGDTAYVWLARGDVLLARKEARADFCFERAFAFVPGDWFVMWLASRIRFFYRQFALAVKLMQQAVEANTGHFLVWLELGRCQQALGLIVPARHSYEQARQLNPRCTEVTVALTKLSQTGVWSRLRGWVWKMFKA
jgi:tetratricopeptide (TPR) repeat protein